MQQASVVADTEDAQQPGANVGDLFRTHGVRHRVAVPLRLESGCEQRIAGRLAEGQWQHRVVAAVRDEHRQIARLRFAIAGDLGAMRGTERQRFAGLLALSTWLPLGAANRAEVAGNREAQPRDLPVFIAHGSYDPMLPLAFGEATRDALLAAGFKPEWHSYPMAHAVCAEEIADIRAWLLRVFGVSND